MKLFIFSLSVLLSSAAFSADIVQVFGNEMVEYGDNFFSPKSATVIYSDGTYKNMSLFNDGDFIVVRGKYSIGEAGLVATTVEYKTKCPDLDGPSGNDAPNLGKRPEFLGNFLTDDGIVSKIKLPDGEVIEDLMPKVSEDFLADFAGKKEYCANTDLD